MREQSLPISTKRERQSEMSQHEFGIAAYSSHVPTPQSCPPPVVSSPARPHPLHLTRHVRFCGVKGRLQRLVRPLPPTSVRPPPVLRPAFRGIVFGAHVDAAAEAAAKTSGCARRRRGRSAEEMMEEWTGEGGGEGADATPREDDDVKNNIFGRATSGERRGVVPPGRGRPCRCPFLHCTSPAAPPP